MTLPELLPSRMSRKEWDEIYVKEVTEVPVPSHLREFLMFSQIFKGEVIYKGRRYRVSGWIDSNKEVYVTSDFIKT